MSCLQADLHASLRARLEVLQDDAFSWEEDQALGATDSGGGGEEGDRLGTTRAEVIRRHSLLRPMKSAVAFGLPRRVIILWNAAVSSRVQPPHATLTWVSIRRIFPPTFILSPMKIHPRPVEITWLFDLPISVWGVMS